MAASCFRLCLLLYIEERILETSDLQYLLGLSVMDGDTEVVSCHAKRRASEKALGSQGLRHYSSEHVGRSITLIYYT